MPRRRRTAKRRQAVLELEHVLELTIGPGRSPAWATEQARREAWEAHRDEFTWEALEHPGSRVWAWWRYDAPSPRDRDVNETLQLDALGLLSAEETAALEERRSLYERTARRLADFNLLLEQDPLAAERVYMTARRSYGIPDWWEPTARPATR